MGFVDLRTMLGMAAAGGLAVLTACGGDSGATAPVRSGFAILAAEGDGQIASPGALLPEPLSVTVTEGGEPASGVEVEWTVVSTAGPGSELVDADGTTGSNGTAMARFRMGETPGEYRVEAALAASEASASFTSRAETPRIATVEKVSGEGQSGMVGAPLPDSLVVRVLDQFGGPLAEVPVRFEITRGSRGNPEVRPDSTRTDPDGLASAELVLGDLNGTYGVTARVDGAEAEFGAEATGGVGSLVELREVRPGELEAGRTASVLGAGFSEAADENVVRVDGRRADVLAATPDSLEIRVPTFEDRCLPRREVDVRVAVGPDSAGSIRSELIPSVEPLDLDVGGSAVLTGTEEVGCALLPAASGGEEYQVTVTPVPATLGVSSMRLFLNGREAIGSASAAEGSGELLPRPAGADEELAEALREAAALLGPGGSGALEAQYRWDRKLREMERRMLGEIRARAARAPLMSASMDRDLGTPSVTVGEEARLNVSCVGDDVTAVARSVSEAAVIYEDVRVAGEAFTRAQYDSIAARFDTISFPVDTTYFGSPADIDGNGRIAILFSPSVNSLTRGSYSEGFTAGFFCPTDLVGGNEAEIVYLVVPDPAGRFNGGGGSLTADQVRALVDGIVVHELQHLINAQIGGGTGPSTNNRRGVNATWINEGLSHLAEEVAGHAVSGNAPGTDLGSSDVMDRFSALFTQYYGRNLINLSGYLQFPSTGPAVLLGEDPGFPDSFRMRGAAWSFVRYLLDRFGSPETEFELTRALIGSAALSGRAAVEEVTGESFESLVADWAASLFVEGRAGLPDRVEPSLRLPSWNLLEIYENVFPQGIFPLQPPTVDLAEVTRLDAELYTGTASYVRLAGTEASSGTGIRLATPAGEPLSAAVEPRLVIVRTR